MVVGFMEGLFGCGRTLLMCIGFHVGVDIEAIEVMGCILWCLGRGLRMGCISLCVYGIFGAR